MAINSPQKYYKASLKRNLNNRIVKKKIKTSTNKLLSAIQNKQSSDEINILFQEAQSFIDKSVTKGVHKKNKASRMKSKIHMVFNSLKKQATS